MESGDKRANYETSIHHHDGSVDQSDTPRTHTVLSKLDIPIHCLDDHQIRRHYLEEYAAKYTKAKHLLSNARKKQRKIILTYYEEKEKQIGIDQLQTIKESLLEENERIKRFKEALKAKLIIYQERIQFLKDTEFWSTLETQPVSYDMSDSIQTDRDQKMNDRHDCISSQDTSTRVARSETLDDNADSPTLPDTVDDSVYLSPVFLDKTSDDTSHLQLDYLEPLSISLITEDYYLNDNVWNYQEPSWPKEKTNMGDVTALSSQASVKAQFDEKLGHLHQWLKSLNRKPLLKHISYSQFSQISLIGMVLLAMFLVLLINNLLEYILRYLAKPKMDMDSVSPSRAPPFLFLFELFLSLQNWTISWFYHW